MKNMHITLKLNLAFVFLVIIAISVNANQKEDSVRLMPAVNFSGYIKSDFIFDSRQNVSVRENMLLLYPRPEIFDEYGSDINDVSNFHFIPFQTRLTARFSGTEILNASTSGLIEAEFFGNTELTANEFRLRHASISMDWQSGVSVLMGQFWHPLFITQCFPATASMNTGIPFNPFARNPQFEISWRRNNIRLSVAAVSQIDFKSNGPQGATSQYIRNSGLPEMVAKFIYFSSDNRFLIGAASSHKKLTPRLTDDTGTKVSENIASASVMGFAKYNTGPATIKLAGIWGQDMFHITMLGGYALKTDNNYTGDPLLNQTLFYTPIGTFSTWGEFIYGNEWEFGLFAGYSQNLGSMDDISLVDREPVFYSRGADIAHLYRISPRLSYIMKNIRLGIETEYTNASYGDSIDNFGIPQDHDYVGNLRILFFAFYNF